MSIGNVGDRSAAVDQILWWFVLQTPTDHDSHRVLHAIALIASPNTHQVQTLRAGVEGAERISRPVYVTDVIQPMTHHSRISHHQPLSHLAGHVSDCDEVKWHVYAQLATCL